MFPAAVTVSRQNVTVLCSEFVSLSKRQEIIPLCFDLPWSWVTWSLPYSQTRVAYKSIHKIASVLFFHNYESKECTLPRLVPTALIVSGQRSFILERFLHGVFSPDPVIEEYCHSYEHEMYWDLLMILCFLTQENISLLLIIIFCLSLRQYVKLHNTLYTALQYSIGTTTVHWTRCRECTNWSPSPKKYYIFCEGHLEDPQLTVI